MYPDKTQFYILVLVSPLVFSTYFQRIQETAKLIKLVKLDNLHRLSVHQNIFYNPFKELFHYRIMFNHLILQF